MSNHTFKISISGTKESATAKAKALATLGSYLDEKTLKALAHLVKNDPNKVAMAKNFLGV